MQRLGERRTAAFIVRVWIEYLSGAPPVWRGEIENVQTKEVVRFRHPGEIALYVQRCVSAQLSRDDEEDHR